MWAKHSQTPTQIEVSSNSTQRLKSNCTTLGNLFGKATREGMEHIGEKARIESTNRSGFKKQGSVIETERFL